MARVVTAGKLARAGIAAAVLAMVLCGPSVAAAQNPLVPDLWPVPLEEDENIGLYPEDEAVVLDVGFRVANIGAGPLELEPMTEPPPGDPAVDCDGDGNPANDRPERQNLYLDEDGDGIFDPDTETQTQSLTVGCSVFHAGHNHWHAALMTTDVFIEGTDTPETGLAKLTYCVVDFDVFDASLPGFGDEPEYSNCGDDATQGISVGWYDQYSVYTPNQQIDVSNLAAGNYCVRQTLDGDDSIYELDETNNVTTTRIALDPAAAELQVLSGPCRLAPDPPVVDTTPPDTRLANAPGATVRTRRSHARVQFGLLANEADALLECSLDGAPYRPCGSPFEARLRARTGKGKHHTFRARAGDAAGNLDSSPAQWSGTVKRIRKRSGK